MPRPRTSPLDIALEPAAPEHAGRCPLAAVDVVVRVAGLVAEYDIAQRFVNTTGAPLAAVLRLPLPDDAVVRALTLRQGSRTLEAAVREVRAARAEYQAALRQGQRAALAESLRANLLELRVAGLAPDAPIELRTRVAAPLAFEGGEVTLVLPVTMTPRYTPPGGDLADARRVVPPFVTGERLYGLSFALDLDAQAEVLDVRSPTHALRVERASPTQALVTLAEGEALPDRDIVVVARLATAADRPMIATARADARGPATVLVALPPPAAAGDDAILPRHVTFLLDRSGSMWGEPMTAARRALRGLVRALGPRDHVGVVAFDDALAEYPPAPFGDASLAGVDRFLAGVDARGGTEILPALRRALEHRVPDGLLRTVVLVTDGAVTDEHEIIAAVARASEKHGLRAHAIGIGPAVHRAFLREFARSGHGLADFVPATGDLEPVLRRFQARSGAPLATDVSLEFSGLAAGAVAPSYVGDVDLGQPVLVLARLAGDGEAAVTLRARTIDGPIERRYPFGVPAGVHGNAAIEALWAKARVDDLLANDPSGITGGPLALALAHRIVSPLTALVAVDREDPGTGEAPREVEVPLHMPAGLEMDAGPAAAGTAVVAGAAAAAPVASAEPTEHDVILESYGTRKIAVIKVVRELKVLGLADAKALVEGAPVTILDGLSGWEARDVARRLTAVGATVGVRPAVGASPYGGYVAPAYVPPPPPPTPEARVEAALRYLARAQSASGAFGDAATTRLVLDAFAAAGETPARGDYRRPLARAEAYWQREGSAPATPAVAVDDAMIAAQAWGGDDDGAVLGRGDALVATASLALALAGATSSGDRPGSSSSRSPRP